MLNFLEILSILVIVIGLLISALAVACSKMQTPEQPEERTMIGQRVNENAG